MYWDWSMKIDLAAMFWQTQIPRIQEASPRMVALNHKPIEV